ncbi:MAG: transglutaminase domain-containing protein, partial [Oscillospiraceae bacterium]
FYREYILCHRVHYEMITSYRKFITEYFEKTAVAKFVASPMTIYDYIQQHTKEFDELDYATISATPTGLLTLGVASKLSQKILFVAICRTFGIPARMSSIDLSLEYMQNNEWHTIVQCKDCEPIRNCKLTLHKLNSEISFEYRKNYTVAFLNCGVYNSLGFEDIDFVGDKITYEIQAGNYRIMTTNRMPNGDVLANIQFVNLVQNESQEITIGLRENRELGNDGVVVPETVLQGTDKEIKPLSHMLNQSKHMVAWLAEGEEPTEHLLNEMLEQQEEFVNNKDRILFILRGEHSLENKKLNTVYENIKMKLAYVPQETSFESEAETVFEALHIANRKLPLVMVLDEQQRCIFSTSGYNVGTGAMILKYLK